MFMGMVHIGAQNDQRGIALAGLVCAWPAVCLGRDLAALPGRGLTMEVPWVDRSPVDIVKEHVRFSLTPFDGPEDAGDIARIFEHLGSNELVLFSTDYPHWQFDGDDPLPAGLPEELISPILVDNPRQTYARL